MHHDTGIDLPEAATDHDAPAVFGLEGVDFAHPGRPPLFAGLDLTLREGQRIGLIGPNGCGKTTLFRLIVGLEKPARGRLTHRGHPVGTEDDLRLLRREVGLLFQNADDQLFAPTVLEDVAFGPLNLGQPPDKALATAEETLKLLRLDGFGPRITHKLSGGEKKLVTLAGVLAMKPAALLLDEPTTGLDPASRERLVDVLAHLPQARIIISHDFDFLASTTTGVRTIRDGRIQAEDRAVLHPHPHLHPLGDVPHTHEG